MIVPIRTTISEEAIAKGLAIAKKIQGFKHIVKGQDPTGVNRDNQWEIGFVGQFHAEEYCRQIGLRYSHRPKASGYSEKNDILVFKNGTSYRVEIKTSGRPFHDCLAFPESQLYAKKTKSGKIIPGILDDVWLLGLLGVRLKNDWAEAEIMGVLPRSRFDEIEKKEKRNTNNMFGVDYATLDEFEIILKGCERVKAEKDVLSV